jgi:hypothetical protein
MPSIESALDKLTKIAQEDALILARCVKLPFAEHGTAVQLPDRDTRKGQTAGWDATTGEFAIADISAEAAATAASAAAAAASATAAASSATAAGASATAAAASDTAAAASATAASTSETNAGTSATAAAASATAASTSETNAGTSATAAAASETAAAASASAASTSETNAASSASAAAASASAASTSETNAASSATGAATSATNAGISEANAAQSEIDVAAIVANLSGIEAITPSDSVFIVGDGASWVGESGATARASLGAQATDATLTALAALAWSAGTQVPVFTASDTVSFLTAGTGANNLVQLDSSAKLPAVDGSQLIGLATVPIGYLSGLTLSNNGTDAAHDIDIATGTATDSTGTYALTLASALTKQLDAAWAVGNNAGGLFSGSIAGATWYHVFLIRKDSGGSIDAGFDTSVTAANIPTGYTAYRRIGSIFTNATPNIIAFTQWGSQFSWAACVDEVSLGTLDTTHEDRTMRVPLGVKVKWIGRVHLQKNVADVGIIITDPDRGITAAASNSAPPFATLYTNGNSTVHGDVGAEVSCITNTSSQIRTNGNAASVNLEMGTLGWLDLLLF